MGAINEAMVKILSEVEAISKDHSNPAQHYKFRGVDDFYIALKPLFAKHGVFVAPEVLSVEREQGTSKSGTSMTTTLLTIKYTFYTDKDDDTVECVVIGEGMDMSDKSANKAMSAAFKYAMMQMFCIPTDEPKDSEYGSPEQVKPEQPPAKPDSDEARQKGMKIVHNLAKELGFDSEGKLHERLHEECAKVFDNFESMSNLTCDDLRKVYRHLNVIKGSQDKPEPPADPELAKILDDTAMVGLTAERFIKSGAFDESLTKDEVMKFLRSQYKTPLPNHVTEIYAPAEYKAIGQAYKDWKANKETTI